MAFFPDILICFGPQNCPYLNLTVQVCNLFGTKTNIQVPKHTPMAFFAMLDYENVQCGPFHQTFSPFQTIELPLIELECANLQFFDALELTYLVIFGPKTNIQVPKEVPKANLVMLSNKNFHLEPFLFGCFTISGIKIPVI